MLFSDGATSGKVIRYDQTNDTSDARRRIPTLLKNENTFFLGGAANGKIIRNLAILKSEKTSFSDGAMNDKVIRIRSEIIVENKEEGTCSHNINI